MAEEYGLTDAGFRIKRLRTILDEVREKMQTVKDPDTGETLEVDFNEDDPFIQFINVCCDELAAIWEVLNAVSNQFDPMKANGVVLSSLVQLNGIMRKQGTPSTVLVTFNGNEGVNIPAGIEVTDEDETIFWKTSENVVIGASGTVTILCESIENGAFNIPPRTINKMSQSIQGITSIINEIASVAGTANESDIALRRRREKSTEAPSQGLAESIYGEISNLDGVLYCKVFTNRTMEEDSKGITPKSIAVVVQVKDKTDEELQRKIGEIIFLRSGLGEEYYNLENKTGIPDYCRREVRYTDIFQQLTIVKFIYPKERPIRVRVTIGRLEDSELPQDYEEQIKNNILEFAQYGVGGLGIETESASTFDKYGFPPSEDIVLSRLFTPINAVKGVKVKSLQIGVDGGALSANDIPIDWYEVGVFAASNIQVILDEE